MNRVTALLLAGGESRRMGRDKALVEWKGRALWQWQLGTLRAIEPHTILISAREQPAWIPADAEFVADAPPSRGPLSGLAAAIAACHTEFLLALAIDMPAMTAPHLRMLCQRATRGGCGVVPVIDGRHEPLCAVYPVAAAAQEIEEAWKGPDASLQPVVQRLVRAGLLSEMTIGDGDRSLYRNMNTPDDLVRLR